MKARYFQKGDSIDITPPEDLDAGEIVRLNNLIGVTRRPIKAGELGTIAIEGIFEIEKPNGMIFHTGANVYWNSGSSSVSSEGVLLGIAVQEAPAAAGTVLVLLNYAGNLSVNSGADDAEAWQTL